MLSEWVCVCVFMPVIDWKPVLLGPQKKTVPLWFNYHSEQSWRGNTRLGDIMVCFTQVFWHKVEQRGLSILKCALTSLISPFRLFPLNVSKLFPHVFLQQASLKWYLIPHVSELICAKFNLEEIALPCLFEPLIWQCWWRHANVAGWEIMEGHLLGQLIIWPSLS